jgi:hypothetical protein
LNIPCPECGLPRGPFGCCVEIIEARKDAEHAYKALADVGQRLANGSGDTAASVCAQALEHRAERLLAEAERVTALYIRRRAATA